MSVRPSIFNVATGETVVQIEHVGQTYGRLRALDDVSLALAPGSCTVLVGHNGAGKSTLIKLLLGLIEPDAGRVQVLGCTPTSRAAAQARRAIGYLPETVALYPALTGAETLAFYARLKGCPRRATPRCWSASASAMRRVGAWAATARACASAWRSLRRCWASRA